MRAKSCILTAVCGNEQILYETAPLMSLFALRCSSDFVLVNQEARLIKPEKPQMMKLHIEKALEKYSRVCWLDYDCLVNPNAPNIFDEVPVNKLGVWSNENNLFPSRPVYKHGYFNSGVMVISQNYKGLIKKAFTYLSENKSEFTEQEKAQLFHEQTALNKIVHNDCIKVYHLDSKWNWLCENNYSQANIIHFAGGSHINDEDKEKALLESYHPRALAIRRLRKVLGW